MQSAHVLITGFVQGVGFRHFIKSKARELGLTGWVRNLPAGRQGLPVLSVRQAGGKQGIPAGDFGQQGSVEALFIGKKENIEEMIALCRKGPFLAEIEELRVEWSAVKEEFKSFEITQVS